MPACAAADQAAAVRPDSEPSVRSRVPSRSDATSRGGAMSPTADSGRAGPVTAPIGDGPSDEAGEPAARVLGAAVLDVEEPGADRLGVAVLVAVAAVVDRAAGQRSSPTGVTTAAVPHA